jgi:subtilisin family serine protease
MHCLDQTLCIADFVKKSTNSMTTFTGKSILHTIGFIALLWIQQPSAAIRTLNPYGRFLTLQSLDNTSSRSSEDVPATYIPVIIKLSTPTDTLPNYVNQLHQRNDIVLATVEQSMLTALSQHDYIHRIEAGIACAPSMDLALSYCNVPQIIANDNNPIGLTGRDVVTGFCDIGFDPTHINFKSDSGELRVKKSVIYSTSLPRPTVATSADAIIAAGSDDSDQFHATHVCGIMSGSYDTPYGHGVATEADIVATTSPLYDTFLLDGCEEIIDYAKSVQKPAVINMSVSSTTGPHDGTTLFNQYLQRLTDDAAICVSAGNDGQRPGYIDFTFTTEQPLLHIYTRQWPTWLRTQANGMIDIWTDDTTSVNMNIVGLDLESKTVSYRWNCNDIAAGEELVVCSAEYADIFPNHALPLLPKRYSGYLYVGGELNSENNRFNGAYICNIIDTTATSDADATVMFGPEIIGAPGTHINVFSSSSLFLDKCGDSDARRGATNLNVNDLAIGTDAICVGSMNSRTNCTMLSGNTQEWSNIPLNDVSYFSSYGTLADGTMLPDICAPGAQVVSSLSSPYIATHTDQVEAIAAYCSTADGNTYYWGPEQGTSMSSPYTAGVIALWLQANPKLTGYGIKQIIQATAIPPTVNTDKSQWGAGILNAEAGLAMAISNNAIHTMGPDTTDAAIKITNTISGNYLISSNESLQEVNVYDIAGHIVLRSTTMANSITLNAQQLTKGIYIINATTISGTTYTQKIAL